MKCYYHLNVGLICGLCAWTMYGDDANGLHKPEDGIFRPLYRCVNPKCEQVDKVVAREPIEVNAEVVG